MEQKLFKRVKAMRQIEEHKVNPCNDVIDVVVVDEPGFGGANHEYDVVLPGGKATRISFQNGAINEHGVNGLTQEALLVICLDRLRCFQKSDFSCRENAIAITKIEEGLMWLHSRTLKRMRDGVEGTHIK